MEELTLHWTGDAGPLSLEMIPVRGTGGNLFEFGEGQETRSVEIPDFLLAAVPVTQALWTHVMREGANPSRFPGDERPVENVSWHDGTGPSGFLARINAGGLAAPAAGRLVREFRLPSETEWEYAARGGPVWRDGFPFSGSSDADAVAWHERNSGPARDPSFWEKRPRSNHQLGTETHETGRKAPNQLGIHDMSGNVWEWCQDIYTPRVDLIPSDGSPFLDRGEERVLRGGCHHNMAMHCTVTKRYAITADHRDECVGFRLAMSVR